jgi:polyphosphate glucokinase
MHVFGLDIGGSGIKGAPVDTATGTLLAERFRIPTPQPATPDAVIGMAVEVVRNFDWHGPIGCGFPAVVKAGVVHTAANIDPAWIGFDLQRGLEGALGVSVRVLNDADAAGMAELRYGAGRDVEGVVLMLTLGTGIGTALFVKGQLVPNTELGHIEIRGKDAEKRAADRVREQKGLSWKEYAARVNEYLDAIERLIWPDLIIIGGGVSKEADKFLGRLVTRAPIVPAQLLNNAGIAGAALAAVPEAPVPAEPPVATTEPPAAGPELAAKPRRRRRSSAATNGAADAAPSRPRRQSTK